ncbi:MAG: hypothetical protein Q9166_002807 [cf. Caloplaca sp. 2 TL-2023]
MAGSHNGPAIFSTNLGRLAPRRPAVLPARIILRSVPEEDMESKIIELCAKYPEQCKAIVLPVTNLYDYFDLYDQELHGAEFLRAVLGEICGRNVMRKQDILGFTHQWARLNPVAFQYVLGLGLDAFTADDVETFGKDFLQDALGELQLQKIKHDDASQYILSSVPEAISLIQLSVALTHVQEHYHVRPPVEHASNGIFPVPPQSEQQAYPSVQRNFSDPTSLRLPVVRPQGNHSVPSSIPSSTPIVSQVFPARAPFPPALQRPGPAMDEPSRSRLPAGPLNSSRRNNYATIPTNINVPRGRVSDVFFAIPPQSMMGGPFPYYPISSGPRGYNTTANRLRNFSKNKGPVYVGPSNDARILEHQGVLRGRGSFGERNMNGNHPHPFGPRTPHSQQHLPSKPNQPSRPSAIPPPRSSGPPTTSPPDLTNGLAPGLVDQDLSTTFGNTDEGLQDTRQEANPRPHAGRPYGYGEEQVVTGLASASTPRQRGLYKDEVHTSEGRKSSEMMTPRTIQGSFIATTTGSPTSHRFPNATDLPHEINISSQYGRQYQSNSGSGGHPSDMDNYPLSDRKLWIGGLLPDTDLEALARLLEPFEPFQLSKLFASKTAGISKPRSEYNSFAFAEFQNPQNAASAVEALNCQFIDVLKCRLLLKPAFLRPTYDELGGSPQKNKSRSKGGSGRHRPNEPGYGYLVCYSDGPPQTPLEQVMQTPSNRNQVSAEWPRLGTNSNNSQVQNVEESCQSSLRSQMANPYEHRIDGVRSSQPQEGNVPEHMPSDATKLVLKPISPATSRSPSSKKKASQTKQRKEMLSNLRTEKPNVGPSSKVTGLANSRDGHQTKASQAVEFVDKEEPRLMDQENKMNSAGMSASALKEELEQYVAPQSNESIGDLSRVHTASTARRRISSSSLVISTDPTSYAHSERSESGVNSTQTPVTPKDDAESTKPQPINPLVLQHDEFAHSLAGIADIQSLKSDYRIVHAADAASGNHSDASARSKGQPRDKAESNTEGPLQGTILQTKIVTCGKAEKEHQPQQPGSQHNESPIRSRNTRDGSQSTSHEKTIRSLEALASPEGSNTTRAAARPMQDMSPNRKRLRDAKTLVAVPKLLPFLKSKPLSSNTDGQASKLPSKPTVSTEPSDSPKVTDPDSKFSAKESEDMASPQLASLPRAKEEGLGSPLAKKIGSPPAFTDTIEPRSPNTAAAGQSETEDLDGSCELASVPDSVATLEGNVLSSIQSTPRSHLTALGDHDRNMSTPQSSEQQPIVQQRKKKNKKGTKSKPPKISQTSSANGSSSTHSRSSTKEEIQMPAVIPQAETPFLADDNTPLPQPSFVRQNHSSMRSRMVRRNQGQQANLLQDSPDKSKVNSDIIEAPAPKSPSEHDGVIFDGEPSDPQSSQGGHEKVAEMEEAPLAENDQRAFGDDERKARLKQMDRYVQESNLAPIGELLKLLTTVAPKQSQQANFEQGSTSRSVVDARIDGLAGMGEPRISEIIPSDKDELLPLSSPTLKEPAQRLLPGPASSKSLFDEPPSVDHWAFQDVEHLEQRVDTSGTKEIEECAAKSSPSTRTVSSEEGRRRSSSPVNGMGIFVTNPPSVKSETVSSLQEHWQKGMSWKDAVVKSATPTIQAGDIVEVLPNEVGSKNKGTQASSVARKAGRQDPWRVPSAEEAWGSKSRSKGKQSAEASTSKK